MERIETLYEDESTGDLIVPITDLIVVRLGLVEGSKVKVEETDGKIIVTKVE